MRWTHTIVCFGNYEGGYEPCGCSSAQSGGQAWERGLIEALGGGPREAVLAVLIGENLAAVNDADVSEIGRRYRALGSAHLCELLGAHRYTAWMVAPRDEPFVVRSESERLYVPGVPFSVAPTEGLRLALVSEAQECRSATAAQVAGQDLVITFRSGPCKPRIREQPADGLATTRHLAILSRPSPAVVEDGDRTLSMLGQRGSHAGVLRIGIIGRGSARDADARLYDLEAVRQDLELIAAGAAKSANVEALRQRTHIAYDWWPTPIFHRGEADPVLLRKLAELKQARSNLLVRDRTHPAVQSPRVQQCATCHSTQAEAWEKGPHGRAFATLVLKGSESDPSCLRCHDTAFRAGGAPRKNGVECSACHAVEGMEGTASLRHGRLDAVRREVCGACHDASSSPTFDFGPYVAKVRCPASR